MVSIISTIFYPPAPQWECRNIARPALNAPRTVSGEFSSADSYYDYLNVFNHLDVVAATDHVLTLVFQTDIEALRAVGVISEILSDDDIAEITPVAEETSAAAKS